MRIGFAEGATSVEALNGWVEPPPLGRVRETRSPHGRDEQLGAIFRQMRAVVGLNQAALARKLGTDVSVIMDLEAGIADGLPPWRDLAAIVERLAFVAGVDPSPILTRLMQVSSAASPAGPVIDGRAAYAVIPPPPRSVAPPVSVPVLPSVTAPGFAGSAPASAGVAGGIQKFRSPERVVARTAAVVPAHKHSKAVQVAASSDTVAPVSRSRSPGRKIGRVAGPLVLLGLLIGGYFTIQHLPQFAYQSVGFFPRRLHEPVRNIIDLAVAHTAAVKDGLRWIDVGDPRLRKGDRHKSR